MMTHLRASEPLSSSHLVPRDDGRTFKVMQIKCVWRLICTQLGRLTIKREPLLGVTASGARQSLYLPPSTPTKGQCAFSETASLFFIRSLHVRRAVSGRGTGGLSGGGPYGTDGPARSPLNPADFPQCLTLSTLINPYTSPRHMVGLVFTQGSPLSTHTHTHTNLLNPYNAVELKIGEHNRPQKQKHNFCSFFYNLMSYFISPLGS